MADVWDIVGAVIVIGLLALLVLLAASVLRERKRRAA